MRDSIRDGFFRYLHEPDTLSLRERLSVEWRLLVSETSRRDYAEMRSMNRVLSRHFAPTSSVVVPVASFSLLKVGLLGIVGAILIGLSFFVWKSKTIESPAAVRGNYAAQRCPHCARITQQCPHCAAQQKRMLQHCDVER